MDSSRLLYLASPFSSPLQSVKMDRFIAVCRATLELTRRGMFVFSPMVNSFPLEMFANGGTSWQEWAEIDRAWIEKSDEVWVLCIDGWRESVGVTAELKIAEQLGKPVKFLRPEGDRFIFSADGEFPAMPTPRQGILR